MQLPSFIFNANTMTPEQLARNRALAEAMLNRGQTGVASNVGEGLAQLGQALGGRLRLSGIDKAMRAGQERAYSGMANAYGGIPAAAPVAAPVVSGGAGGGGGGGVPKGKQGFVDMLGPAAIQYGNQIGVDPRIILAQAAQETGWGRSAPGNNYFGIKSHGKGGGQTFTTHEVINGKRVKTQDSFRSFNSPADSVAGYADFLTKNKRYRPMLGAKGLEAQVAALGQSGYATDPNYGSSIYNIAKGINLDGVQIVPASAPPPGAMPVSEDTSVTQTPLGSQKPMGTAMTGFQQPKVFAPAPGMQPQSPQISTAPASAPPQAPQMARQAPLSAYQRMMATSLGKEAGGLAAPPNRVQMASVMGNTGPARSPFAAPAPMSVDAPQNFAAPSPLTAPAPSAPQQSRSAGLRSFIGSSDFAHLEPAQQQMVIADYNRALEAEQPKAPSYKYFEVGGDQYRVNEADPTAKPELFIDGPDKAEKPPAGVQEYQFYVQQETAAGRKPVDYFTWEKAKVPSTSVSVTNGSEVGTIPQGFELFTDPKTGARSMRPIAGGPAAIEAETAKSKADKARGNQEVSADIVTQDIDRALGIIDSAAWYNPAAGIGAETAGNIAGSNSAKVQGLLETIKANVGFDALSAMRQASPTGGALGAVTVEELRLLTATLGSLQQSQGPEQLRENLVRLWNVYQDTIHGPGNGPARREIKGAPTPSAATAPNGNAPALNVGARQSGAPSPAPVQQGTPNQGGPSYKEGDILRNAAGQQVILRNNVWVPYDGQ